MKGVRVELKQLGALSYIVSAKFPTAEVAETRKQLLLVCGRIFDESIKEAKKKAKNYVAVEVE